MIYFVRVGYATFRRNWIVVFRAYPWSFFFGGLFSGICSAALASFSYYLLAYGQLDEQFSSYAGTSDYLSYVILGGSILSFSIGILLGVSRGLITERREGTLESLLLAPSRRFSYFAGITVQWVVTCLGEAALLLLCVAPFGLHLSHVNWASLLLTFPIALLGLFGMSTVLGALMLATGDTYVSQNTLFAAMTFLCGFAFPVNYLPLPLQWLGAVLPVSGAVHLLRAALLNGSSPAQLGQEMLLYLVLGLAYAFVGLSLMRGAERRALEGAF